MLSLLRLFIHTILSTKSEKIMCIIRFPIRFNKWWTSAFPFHVLDWSAGRSQVQSLDELDRGTFDILCGSQEGKLIVNP